MRAAGGCSVVSMLAAVDKVCLTLYWSCVFMLQKLFAMAAGRVREDNPDSLVNQEVLLPGHLWGMILKEKLHDYLQALRQAVTRELRYGTRRRFGKLDF